LFTIGALAKALGCSIKAIRLWEKNGVVPETPIRSPKGDRLYTAEMVDTIRTVLHKQGRLSKTKMVAQSRPKGLVKKVQFANGGMKEVRLFRIGALAKVVGRTVVGLQQMEQKETMPVTSLRASSVKYRLYTVRQIEVVKDALDKREGTIKDRADAMEFRKEVDAGWKRIGVIGAKVIETEE